MNKIIWTRSQDAWIRDESLLRKGLSGLYLHLPCVQVQFLQLSISLDLFSAHKNKELIMIFTSVNAVRSMIFSPYAHLLKKAKIFTFGFQTNLLLKTNGYQTNFFIQIYSAESMSIFLANMLDKSKVFILLPGPVERAFPMAEYFYLRGFVVKKLDCYQVVKKALDSQGHILTKKSVINIVDQLQGVICFASPSAVDGFIFSFSTFLKKIDSTLTCVTIGETTQYHCCKFFSKVYRAKEQTVPSMIEAASEILA